MRKKRENVYEEDKRELSIKGQSKKKILRQKNNINLYYGKDFLSQHYLIIGWREYHSTFCCEQYLSHLFYKKYIYLIFEYIHEFD